MNRKTIRMISMVLAMVMIFCAGCGKAGTSEENIPDNQNKNVVEGDKDTSDASDRSMGRYIENVNSTLSSDLSSRLNIVKMKDGGFTIFDADGGMWVSSDEGETWERKSLEWYNELKGSSYIMDVSVSPDGYIGVVYVPEDADAEEQNEFHPKYKLISPDETAMDIEISLNSSDFINKFYFSQESRMFAYASNGSIYEINKEDGTYDLVTELSDRIYQIEAAKNTMICVNASGAAMIDLDTKEVIKDKVLDEFITSTFGSSFGAMDEGVIPLLVMMNEGNLYLVCEKGIYRHVIGGSAMEQVADGALTSLSNPSFQITGGILYDEDSFFILFKNGSMIRYTFDPDMPTVPAVQLRAYSLREMEYDPLKQAISLYQAEHPEVYVKYEVGMDANSSITREDAIKKLNTEMVAGTGPDLIVLDDLPLESYMDKGILMDLTPYLDNIKEKEDVFINLIDGFKTEKGTYAVPAQFALPLLIGKESDMGQVTDLETLADQVEKVKKDNMDSNFMWIHHEKELLMSLMAACAPAWKTENGKLNEEALKEYFIQAKRIWDAEVAVSVLTNEERDEAREQTEAECKDEGLDIRVFDRQVKKDYLDIRGIGVIGEMGILGAPNELDHITSIFKMDHQKGNNFYNFKGQASNVYIPHTILGINSKTANADEAGELLAQMFGYSNTPSVGAYSVNKKTWNDSMVAYATSDGSYYSSSGGGDKESLYVYSSSKEEISRLEKIIESAVNPYIQDSVLEDAVCETGVKILRGETSVESGVTDIVNKLAIYLAE